MKPFRLLSTVALVSLLLAACGSAPPPREGEAEMVCVTVADIHDFDALDERHVVVEARSRDFYLLTLAQRCSGITFSPSIRIAERSSRICGDRSSELAFDRPGIPDLRCRILTIERVDDLAAAKALVAARSE